MTFSITVLRCLLVNMSFSITSSCSDLLILFLLLLYHHYHHHQHHHHHFYYFCCFFFFLNCLYAVFNIIIIVTIIIIFVPFLLSLFVWCFDCLRYQCKRSFLLYVIIDFFILYSYLCSFYINATFIYVSVVFM